SAADACKSQPAYRAMSDLPRSHYRPSPSPIAHSSVCRLRLASIGGTFGCWRYHRCGTNVSVRHSTGLKCVFVCLQSEPYGLELAQVQRALARDAEHAAARYPGGVTSTGLALLKY